MIVDGDPLQGSTSKATSARKTRTLYVREDDQAIWDRAREAIGDSLSTHLTNYLRGVVAQTEAAERGCSRIVLSFRERGVLFRVKAFHGRWLISPDRPWIEAENGRFTNEEDPPHWCVAITVKNNYVFFRHFGRLADERATFAWGEFYVFESFEQAAGDREVPEGLVAEAMERQGVEIEELDI